MNINNTSYSDGFGIFNKVSEEKIVNGQNNTLRLFMLNTENKLFNYDELYEYILPNVVKYVFSRKRLAGIEDDPQKQMTIILEALSHLRPIENEKDKGAGGELGEILLYLFLEQDLKAPKLFSKVELKQIEKKIHKEYYLAQLVRKRVAYHIGALPAEIRAQIEGLIRKGIIKYCFCTSTLLEGVNVPVDNLFIFDNKKARSKMSITDAFNLMGRAGRVTLNEYGNVYLIVEDKDVKKYYDDILLKPLPRQELLPSKAISKKNKKYIVQTLLSGRTNLLEMGDKYKDKGFTETTYEYSAKCLNILLHDICSNNDSYIVRDFKNDQALTPQNIIDIREIFGVITEKDDDINISARQKESLYKAVREQHLNYPSSIAYDTCVDFLKELSRILDWKIYEKDSLGKGEKIRYYAVILNQWMEGKGLHEIIRGAIKHYQTNGGSLVSYEPNYHLEKYNDSTQHKNQVINEVMKDIEQIINYKFSMYFLRLSEAIIEIHGEKALVNDWYEYVEYGTNNNSVIILQKYGFLREEALELLKPPLLDHIKFEKQRVIIKNSIMDIASQDLQDKIATIKINYPEIFSD